MQSLNMNNSVLILITGRLESSGMVERCADWIEQARRMQSMSLVVGTMSGVVS